ncbi:acetyl-CoA carboxylase biotin carboxyl carrier protein [Acuticoccus sp. MNP-M23]|uniref:acetyl-CoA carboxylase biotin carboxyl carrier protein n=1 Tax=Acuticoccus sp. MNP-M23 TaxID=3072793 RepID=UPI002815A74D|nr:acetyl-CoA carboxylase biotin carboxyl carrier protein [Acuticoccus sp. MNP-M23]WMS42546.1 acetyl-CoA carboxylase biotin carboxyl carrier protein [Acuticoccus sp. MNP-M23]
MAQSNIDEAAIRSLAALLHENDLSEIEIVEGDSKLRVTRQVTVQAAPAMPAAAAAPVAARTDSGSAPAGRPEGAVISPMVGTAYRASEPGSRPFVEVGDTVRAGQVVMIVEAMKTMNQIICDVAGTVREVFVEDGQPVEYGEPLLAIS